MPELTGKLTTLPWASVRNRVPDAIFAYNSAVALGVLPSLNEHGLQVPGDVAVIGVDDTPVAPCMNPSLSVIAIDMRALATRALDHLEEQLDASPGACAPRYEVIPCHLVARESTAPQ
jgi:DNA-binding LacI/PurR family transcriptional regulator